MTPPTQKDPAAFRTISEVSNALGVPPHVLRFWETRFPELKPLQRGGNRRYYRPADIALAAALHKLLHQHGYTVKGVRKLISDHGVAALPALAGTAPLPDAAAAPDPHMPLHQPAVGNPGLPAGLIAELRTLRDQLHAALA